MLANRTFMITTAWKIACAVNPISNTLFTFQKMSRGKDQPIPIYLNTKIKSTISVWRPKSTQSGTAVAGIASPPSSSLADNNNQSKHTSVDMSTSDDCSRKCSVSLEVGASLIRFVKGKGGSTQQQIEEETGTKILFSSLRSDDHIVIEGSTNESVTKASEKIAIVLEEAVKSRSLDYSHFVSLPLAIHPELVDKLQNFQNAILGCSNFNEGKSDNSANEKSTSCSVADSNAKLGIDKSIFIKPKTFHLTVVMLKLWNKDRITAATEVLQKISSEVHEALDNRPVFIRLRGLECMQGSPAKARVIYAPVEEIGAEGRLLNACNVITKAYIEAGLVLEKDAHRTLKLHATIINAGHGKRSYNRKKPDTFDARNIFSKYGSENWGEYIIREGHLSERFKYDENGYYHCCASFPFPASVQVE